MDFVSPVGHWASWESVYWYLLWYLLCRSYKYTAVAKQFTVHRVGDCTGKNYQVSNGKVEKP